MRDGWEHRVAGLAGCRQGRDPNGPAPSRDVGDAMTDGRGNRFSIGTTHVVSAMRYPARENGARDRPCRARCARRGETAYTSPSRQTQ